MDAADLVQLDRTGRQVGRNPVPVPALRRTAVLVGARTPAETDESAAPPTHPVPDAFWAALDGLGG